MRFLLNHFKIYQKDAVGRPCCDVQQFKFVVVNYIILVLCFSKNPGKKYKKYFHDLGRCKPGQPLKKF